MLVLYTPRVRHSPLAPHLSTFTRFTPQPHPHSLATRRSPSSRAVGHSRRLAVAGLPPYGVNRPRPSASPLHSLRSFRRVGGPCGRRMERAGFRHSVHTALPSASPGTGPGPCHSLSSFTPFHVPSLVYASDSRPFTLFTRFFIRLRSSHSGPFLIPLRPAGGRDA